MGKYIPKDCQNRPYFFLAFFWFRLPLTFVCTVPGASKRTHCTYAQRHGWVFIRVCQRQCCLPESVPAESVQCNEYASPDLEQHFNMVPWKKFNYFSRFTWPGPCSRTVYCYCHHCALFILIWHTKISIDLSSFLSGSTSCPFLC